MVRAGHREARPVFSLVMWVCRRTSASDRKLRSFIRSVFVSLLHRARTTSCCCCCLTHIPPITTMPRLTACLVVLVCLTTLVLQVRNPISHSISLSRTHTNDRWLACWLGLEPRRRRHILPSASTSTCLRRTRRRSSKLPRSLVSMWLSLTVANAVAVRPSHGTDQVRRRLLQTKQSRTCIFGG